MLYWEVERRTIQIVGTVFTIQTIKFADLFVEDKKLFENSRRTAKLILKEKG